MIGLLAGWLMSRKPSLTGDHARRLALVLLVSVLVIVAAIGGCVLVQERDEKVVEAARVEANNEALQDQATADAAAAVARVEDARRRSAEIDDLVEAIDDAPNPDDARRAYYRCVRLQQAARAAGAPAPACS